MENQDEYVLKIYENGDGAHYYYKNGLLHREAGSAILKANEVRTYTPEPDEGLYRKEVVPDITPYKEPTNEHHADLTRLTYISTAYYYLEGVQYEHVEFKKMLSILQAKKELENDLNTNKPTPKRLKV